MNCKILINKVKNGQCSKEKTSIALVSYVISGLKFVYAGSEVALYSRVFKKKANNTHDNIREFRCTMFHSRFLLQLIRVRRH